jgi:UDP-N-acetylglucosamine 2-epimerase (hydrolysing)
MGTDSSIKKILFLTGTRADFGKLQPLMLAVEDAEEFDCHVFVTGMHTLSRYGYTAVAVQKAGFKNIYINMNQYHSEPVDLVLANTIGGLSRYVHENLPDLIVVHGDRIEALAGAIVGVLQNILVAHIEGGEVSGTVDEIIRHAVSKLSHLHFVANEEAAKRLKQLGEVPSNIHTIGSPDIDIMLSSDLPTLQKVKRYYNIVFDEYAIALFHPVTTEVSNIQKYTQYFVDALKESKMNYIVVYPNNDEGSEIVFQQINTLMNNPRFHLAPSFRFVYFLVLLKFARYIIGNSSAGIREAPVYGVPTINVGTRQNNRYAGASIENVSYEKESILRSIQKVLRDQKRFDPCDHFGKGNSLKLFMEKLGDNRLWETSKQKQFRDVE